jgi:hypothetical protein
MTLEEYIARLNGLAFWKEFTFANNKFMPLPGKELELADNFVWLGDYAFVLQLKERIAAKEDPEAERGWFRNKVLGKATKQVRDTLQFLRDHETIRLTDERGHAFEIRGAQLTDITSIVVFLGGQTLPKDCLHTHYHVSSTAGFIHILAAHDYLGVLGKLRVPEDIRRYFAYRREVTQRLRDAGIIVEESDIMGAFVGEQDAPTQRSREILDRFVQDLDAFDLSQLIGNLHDHVKNSEQPQDYYRIMLEFARVPRSVWREVKLRFMLSLETIQKKQFTSPFRLAFPAADCAFMIVALHSQIPATGPEGETMRVTGLKNLTYAAMYAAKVSKGVGIMISKDGDYLQLDWSWLNLPWKPDPEMDRELAANNPFGEAKEKTIDSFLFASEIDGSEN